MSNLLIVQDIYKTIIKLLGKLRHKQEKTELIILN